MAITHRFTHDQASNTIEHVIVTDGVQTASRNYSAIQRDELLANSGNAAAPYVSIAGWTDAYIAAKVAEEQAAAAAAEEAANPKEKVLAQATDLRDKIVSRLVVLQLSSTDQPTIDAIKAAIQALITFNTHPSVVAATTGKQTKTAVMTIWYQTATTLAAAAPSAATAFENMGM